MSQPSEPDGQSALARMRISCHSLRCRLALRFPRIHRRSIRCEHWGFVAVAAIDAFHWHSYLFVVSLWLLVTGLVMEIFEGVD